jgi:hypothetical protein
MSLFYFYHNKVFRSPESAVVHWSSIGCDSSQMNSRLSLYQSDKFKCCNRRGCNQKPIKYLRIKYVNKIGSFCDRCVNDLLESGLAEDIGASNSFHPSVEVIPMFWYYHSFKALKIIYVIKIGESRRHTDFTKLSLPSFGYTNNHMDRTWHS